MATLREMREAAGLTQEGLGRRVGVGQSSVKQWENGRSLPTVGRLLPICAALNCSLDDLIDALVACEATGKAS